MNQIVSAVTKVPEHRNDDDFVDRLNNRYTVMVIVVFAIVVTSQLYTGTPITCWADKHFTGNHIKYTNSYCWVRNTYYLPFEEEIPKAHEDDKRKHIVYYQWMPFILLAQALFFYLPSTVWNGFNQKAGVDCDNILAAACQLSKVDKEKNRATFLRMITNQLDRFLDTRVKRIKAGMPKRAIIHKLFCGLFGSRMGNYLCFLYIFSKMLYVANVISQLFVMNAILRTNFSVYGFELIHNLIYNDNWVNSNAFPRVTMCDFKVRRLGNVQRYTVQCVLPINMYTEKIYAFMWFWMVFIALMNAMSLLVWIGRILIPSDRVKYIHNHLRIAQKYDPSAGNEKLIKDFTYNFMQQDGVFIMRLIGHNTNNITVTDIIAALWDHWKLKIKTKDAAIDEPDHNVIDKDATIPLIVPSFHKDKPAH